MRHNLMILFEPLGLLGDYRKNMLSKYELKRSK
jgi:hypothetical protein